MGTEAGGKARETWGRRSVTASTERATERVEKRGGGGELGVKRTSQFKNARNWPRTLQ